METSNFHFISILQLVILGVIGIVFVFSSLPSVFKAFNKVQILYSFVYKRASIFNKTRSRGQHHMYGLPLYVCRKHFMHPVWHLFHFWCRLQQWHWLQQQQNIFIAPLHKDELIFHHFASEKYFNIMHDCNGMQLHLTDFTGPDYCNCAACTKQF